MISRLEFTAWNRKVEEYEDCIKELERRLHYRKIEVLGPRDASNLKRLTCEESQRLECDPTIITLNNELARWRNDLDYLYTTGDIPEYRK
jgi:hypothetical protein